MKTLVITGLSGAIGKQLIPKLPSDYIVWSLYHHTAVRSRKLRRRELCVDITDRARVHRLLNQINPDVIVHMAAQTHIDQCEEDKKNGKHGKVWSTNVTATAHLVEYARQSGAFLCMLSTECVFPGIKQRYSEYDERAPINWYGTTKYHAERVVETLPRFAILRAVMAFHSEVGAETLYGKFANAMRTQPPLRVVNDTAFSPTHTPDIVQAILAIVRREQVGIFHVCSPDLITPYTFATKLAKWCGMDPKAVVEGVSITAVLGKRRANRRLRFSSLDCQHTQKTLGISAASVDSIFHDRLRILQVVPYFFPAWAYGGPAKLVYDMSDQLSSKGHSVTVYTSDAYDASSRMPESKRILARHNFVVHYFQNLSNRLAFSANGYLPLRLFLVVPFSLRQFDVIHMHDFYTLANIWIGLWARIYRIPYVLSVHGCLESARRLKRSRIKSLFLSMCGLDLLRHASTLIATSANERVDLLRVGVPKQNIVLLQHGVKPEEFLTLETQASCRAEFALPKESLILVFIGRIHPIKGLDLLISALAASELRSVYTVIAGTDEGILATLQDQVHALGLEKRIRFMGPISGDKKARLFRAADAFVYPSRSEGFSVGILEAAAAGLPLLLTQGCHFPEVARARAGFIAPVSESGISEMLRKFSQLRVSERRAMGSAAASLCRSAYSAVTVLRRLEKMYQHVSSPTH